MSGHYRKFENSENADDLFGRELPKKKHKPKAKPEDLKVRGDSYIDGLILSAQHLTFSNDDQKNEFLGYLESLKRSYKPTEEKDLRVLLRVLQEHVTKSIKGYDLKKAHDLIVHQEAFKVSQTYHEDYQAFRQSQDGRDKQSDPQHRQDFLVTTLTGEQKESWLAILTSPGPEWFKALDPLIQKQYKVIVKKWSDDTSSDKPNLGHSIGLQSSTVRATPGSANLWVQKITQNGEATYKIRSAYVVPFDMITNMGALKNPEDKKRAKQEIIDSTAGNIKQQLALALYLKMREKVEKGLEPKIQDFDLLLQNLISLPFQPEPMGREATNILYQALKQVRDEIKQGVGRDKIFDQAKQFATVELRDSDPEGKPIPVDTKEENIRQNTKTALENSKADAHLSISFSAHPVNKARGLATFVNFFSIPKQIEAWRVNRKIEQMQKTMKTVESPNLEQKKKLAAIELRQEIGSTSTTFISGLRGKHTYNPNAERAALEQIIMQGAGYKSNERIQDSVRTGSCVSGKDREEMIGLIKLAMEAIYEKYGAFPSKPGSERNLFVKGAEGKYEPYDPKKHDKQEPIDLREQFETELAKRFIKGDGPSIAALNAKGSDGLKNILDVLGVRVCKKICEEAKDDNYVKACQVAADTNKVKFKKTDGLEVQELAAKMRPIETSPHVAASNTVKVSKPQQPQKPATMQPKQQPQPQPQPPQKPAITQLTENAKQRPKL